MAGVLGSNDGKHIYKICLSKTSYIGKLSNNENPITIHAKRNYVNENYQGWEGDVLRGKDWITKYYIVQLDDIIQSINNKVNIELFGNEYKNFWNWCVKMFQVNVGKNVKNIRRSQWLAIAEMILILNNKKRNNIQIDFIGNISKIKEDIENGVQITTDIFKRKREKTLNKILSGYRTFEIETNNEIKKSCKVLYNILTGWYKIKNENEAQIKISDVLEKKEVGESPIIDGSKIKKFDEEQNIFFEGEDITEDNIKKELVIGEKKLIDNFNRNIENLKQESNDYKVFSKKVQQEYKSFKNVFNANTERMIKREENRIQFLNNLINSNLEINWGRKITRIKNKTLTRHFIDSLPEEKRSKFINKR